MPRNALVLTVFVASPNDLGPERDLVARCVEEWNQISGFNRDLRFELLRWETSISAGFGSDGQDVVNHQLPNYDLLIALFWTRLGTATPRSVSGTSEEYERALERFKAGEKIEIAFYFKDVAVNPREVDLSQLAAVQEYEKSVQTDGAFSKRFANTETLRFEISLLLDRVARQYSTRTSSSEIVDKNAVTTANRANLTDPSDQDELGLFDIVENLQNHASEATATLGEIITQMQNMTDRIAVESDSLGGIAKLRPLTPSEARPHVNRVASGMDEFSLFLENAVPVFAESSISLANDIRQLIDVSYDFAKSDGDAETQLAAFEVAITSMLAGLEGSQLGYQSMLETLLSLQRTTTEFNRARRRLVQNIVTFIDTNNVIKNLTSQALQELRDLIEWLRSNDGES